jgi:serine/threonine-protein kinase RsbT
MNTEILERLRLVRSEDVIRARQAARRWSADLGFSLVDQTKIVTAVSELARNMVEYGGGGAMVAEIVRGEAHTGLRVTFEDQGPGIPDVELALRDGYGTGHGLGLGLGGARRLMDEFVIQSVVGEGTRISVTRWT